MDLALTAWKVSRYGVISGPYLPVFRLNTGRYGPEITPYLGTFYAVTPAVITFGIAVDFDISLQIVS